MNRAGLRIALIAAFAAVAGYYFYRVTSPLPVGRHFTSVTARPLMLPGDLGGSGKSLYLRQNVRLPQRPDHAWVRVLGHDVILMVVNGQLVGRSFSMTRASDNALLIDVTPYMKRGDNCIAVVAYQRSLNRPPAMAIDGEFVYGDGRREPLGDDWLCTDHFERQSGYWYEVGFDPANWRAPVRGAERNLSGHVEIPPRAVMATPTAEWIAPPAAIKGRGAVRRTFRVDGAPQTAWLRMVSSSPCRVAINGNIVLSDLEELGAPPPYRRTMWALDISEHVRRGENLIAVMMSAPSETPHVSCQLEVEDRSGARTAVATDASWLGAAGNPVDWHALEDAQSEDHLAAWSPCRAEVGRTRPTDLRLIRGRKEWRAIAASPARPYVLLAAWVAAAALVSAAGVIAVNHVVAEHAPRGAAPDAAVALAPLIAAGLVGMLTAYDPGVDLVDIYSLRWLGAGAVYLLGAWAILLVMASRARRSAPAAGGGQPDATPHEWLARHGATAVLLALIAAAGLYLRTANLLDEPMHHDEVGAYFFTYSTLQQGFPGGQVHPDMPFGYAATSELVYFFNAPFALLFDEPRLVIRVPAVIWSMLTLGLLYYVAARLFGRTTGLIAATLFALSPYLVGMSNFGRYFSQLQFFSLLTCYAYYRTIEGSGPINRRALWLTVIGFIATYLTWEASAFLGLGMFAAGLIYRRGGLKYLLTDLHTYAGSAVIILVILAQNAHRLEQQVQRLWYGTGISDVTITPMWRYPYFDPTFYIEQTSWSADTLLAMLGLFGAGLMALTHPRRDAVRVMLMIVVFTCVAMAALLPLRATRYVFHLTPLTILLAAAALDALAGAIARTASGPTRRGWSLAFARTQTALATVTVLVIASGLTAQTLDLSRHAIAAYRPGLIKFAHWEEPLRYVRENLQEGDVVISLYPHLTDLTMQLAEDSPVPEEWRSEYWLQSIMVLQATLSDSVPRARDRRAGTIMVSDREALENVFDKHPRVWYLTIRSAHTMMNRSDVSAFVRQHMDVVYEDARVLVFLRSGENRTAGERRRADEEAEEARTQVIR